MTTALSELVILATGRCWSANFEWEQHAPLAKKAGINIKHINQIASANRPIFKIMSNRLYMILQLKLTLKKMFLIKYITKPINY